MSQREFLRELFVSRDHFTEAFGFTKHMLDGELYELTDETSVWTKKAYILSIIASYIRPFTCNKLTPNSLHKSFDVFIESEFSPQEKNIHYKIINLEDKMHAYLSADSTESTDNKNMYLGCYEISNSIFNDLSKDGVKLLQNILIKLLSFVARETSKCM